MNSILGVHASFPIMADATDFEKSEHELKKQHFKEFLWGEDGYGGLSKKIKALGKNDYGKGVNIILLQFVVGSSIVRPEAYKEIENYRPAEKSIGVWIAADDKTYFSKNDEDRIQYINTMIHKRLLGLKDRLKKHDIDMDKLIDDVDKLLS